MTEIGHEKVLIALRKGCLGKFRYFRHRRIGLALTPRW